MIDIKGQVRRNRELNYSVLEAAGCFVCETARANISQKSEKDCKKCEKQDS